MLLSKLFDIDSSERKTILVNHRFFFFIRMTRRQHCQWKGAFSNCASSSTFITSSSSSLTNKQRSKKIDLFFSNRFLFQRRKEEKLMWITTLFSSSIISFLYQFPSGFASSLFVFVDVLLFFSSIKKHTQVKWISFHQCANEMWIVDVDIRFIRLSFYFCRLNELTMLISVRWLLKSSNMQDE